MDIFIQKLVNEALLPFKQANSWIIKAENLLISGDPPIRDLIMEYEKNINDAWEKAYKEFGVKHCFDLPKDIYNMICNLYIVNPGAELINKLSKYAADYNNNRHYANPVGENPYALAIGAIALTYNLKVKK